MEGRGEQKSTQAEGHREIGTAGLEPDTREPTHCMLVKGFYLKLLVAT